MVEEYYLLDDPVADAGFFYKLISKLGVPFDFLKFTFLTLQGDAEGDFLQNGVI